HDVRGVHLALQPAVNVEPGEQTQVIAVQLQQLTKSSRIARLGLPHELLNVRPAVAHRRDSAPELDTKSPPLPPRKFDEKLPARTSVDAARSGLVQSSPGAHSAWRGMPGRCGTCLVVRPHRPSRYRLAVLSHAPVHGVAAHKASLAMVWRNAFLQLDD